MAQATVGPSGPELIDLGEVGWRATEEVVPRGWALPPRAWRPLALLVVIGVVVATSVASGTPAPKLGRPLWTASAGQRFHFGATNLYISHPGGDGLEARAAPTGRLRWQAPGRDMSFSLESPGGLVLLVGLVVDPRPQPETVVVDAATGRVLTRHLGAPIGLASEQLVLVIESTGDACDGPVGCFDLVAMNVASGREAWRLPMTNHWAIDGGRSTAMIRRVVVANPDGQATVHDATSGATVASMRLDITLPLDPSARPTRIYLSGDVVYTVDALPDGVRVTRLPIGSASPIWSTTVSGPPLAVDQRMELTPIGDRLALIYGDQTAVLDAVTGRRLFGLESSFLTDLGDGRALAVAYHPEELTTVVDMKTGARVATYPGLEVIPFENSGGRVLLAQSVVDRTVVRLLDAEGRPVMIDDITGVNVLCRARDDILACTDGTGRLRVWRLPDDP